MVALLTPARAATASMFTAARPCSRSSSAAAVRMALLACSLRGRPRCWATVAPSLLISLLHFISRVQLHALCRAARGKTNETHSIYITSWFKICHPRVPPTYETLSFVCSVRRSRWSGRLAQLRHVRWDRLVGSVDQGWLAVGERRWGIEEAEPVAHPGVEVARFQLYASGPLGPGEHPDPVAGIEYSAQLAVNVHRDASGTLQYPDADGFVGGEHEAAVERHVGRDRCEDQRVELRGEHRAAGGEAVRGGSCGCGHDDCVGGVGGEQAARDVDGEACLAVAGELFDDNIILGDDVGRDAPADLIRQARPHGRWRQCRSAAIVQQR